MGSAESRMAAIDKLFNAKAVAIVGATPDLTKLGSSAIVAMHNLGYKSEIWAVNPRYTEIMGHPCVASVDDLPPQIEAAMLNVPADAAIEALEACARKGIKAVVLVAQGFGEAGGKGLERDARVVAAARHYGMAITGPNTNGLANAVNGQALAIAPAYQFAGRVKPGSVALVSQSGAMVSTILTKLTQRGVGISKTVTCGNELILNVADYLAYMVEDPETSVIVLFLETIRDGEELKRSLALARAAGKPVVAIKIGQSDSGQKAALSHTGAIAGSYRNTAAFLGRQGVLVADNIETLAALTELVLRQSWPLDRPAKPCVVSISGGFAALAADEMTRCGLVLADPSPAAAAELSALPTQSHAVNPYDIAAQNALIPAIIDIFKRDGFNQLIFGLALLKDDIRRPVIQMILDAKAAGFPQVYIASPEVEPEEKVLFHRHGITVSEDPRPLFQALELLARWKGPRAEPTHAQISATALLPAGAGLMNEAESKAVLAGLGFRIPQARVLGPGQGTGDLADLRRPLVVKGLSDRVAHKSEHGLVALGLNGDADLAAALDRVRRNLAEADPEAGSLLVEEMIGGGLEAILGVQRDPILGPMVVVGAGGILVELLDDVAVLAPPFTAEELSVALDRTRFGRLLRGFRGQKPDRDALITASVAIGKLALSEPRLESLDINPLFVMETGVCAIDAKIFVAMEKA
ncbi:MULTISPECIES: acetate--CoA ligase family protein [unclassified Chelatococcus]|uniref:acetate--CoA ligase family protein n=1 Tax=unclassified Chelatococcus TaxID=2638111 RepID=UPI001BD0365B|nr:MULTISPECIES: acetate--CoA ligase family protein [unclassified Chelatococcus]MBS7700240.1 acetate--CoA ligase family protein [Chelatococcus sp. YT9]MBX3558211.1 acetate--CoA ligase family protein [Chelatococcus sp.]